MDDETAGLVKGDVLIEDERIADVAAAISSADAEVIDGRGMIAMPGLVDTHRHMWAAMLRGGACYGNLHDYFIKVVFSYGAAYTPEDTYKSIRFGLAEAVASGITTVHGWEHNIQTPDHARNDEEISRLAESGTPVSISILSNLRCGMGLPPVLKMTQAGANVGISMDTMAAADNSDMFNAMRITMGIERAKADDGAAYQPMEVLRQGTCTAASTLGLAEVTGALRKRLAADVILLRADDLNMAPLNVLDGQVVLAAQPSNVDTVFIDGVLRKRHGELLDVDEKALVRGVTQAVESLRKRVDVSLA